MKKIFISITVLFLIIPQFIFGQEGWVKKFSTEENDVALNLIQIDNGNYAFLMGTEGDLGSGFGPGNYIIKIDVEGNILSQQLISEDLYDLRVYEIFYTQDNGFIVHAARYVGGNFNGYKPYFIKYDENGNIEWEKFFYWDINLIANYVLEIIQLSDGNFLISGHDKNFITPNLFFRKLDSNFNEIWTTTLPKDYLTSSLVETSTGNLTAVGYIDPLLGIDTFNCFFFTMDAAGNELINTTIPELQYVLHPVETYNSNNLFIHNHPTGGYVIIQGGSNYEFDFSQNLISDSGIFINATTLNDNDYLNWLIKTNTVDDGFIITGSSQNGIPFGGGKTLALVKTDFNGNILWKKYIDIAENNDWDENGIDIIQTNDNGYLGIGYYKFLANGDFYLYKTDSLGNIYPNQIIGKIGYDTLLNCQLDSNELGLSNWLISAETTDQTFFATSDSVGNYSLSIDTGNYVVKVHPPNDLWSSCENEVNISVAPYTVNSQDFPIEVVADCPFIVINTTLFSARPCFNNNRYYLNYCNFGTVASTNSYVEIEIDPNLTYVSSSIGLVSQNGNTLVFNLDDIPIGECDNFYIDFLVDCDTEIGKSICIESHIYPDSFCIVNPNWNGAFVEVDAECQDSTLLFSVENTGIENMTSPNQYIVIEDAILLISNSFQLLAGEVDSFSIPTNGATFQLIAEQVANAPGEPFPTAWVEGCGINGSGSFSLGFLNQFSLGDNNPFMDTDCTVTSSSFDPNDKQGFPIGYSDEHFIRPNTDLEYLIRFQNTGTDTAFTVVIRDTIADELDLTSIQVGAASHSYSWRIYGENVLEFTFNSIMLPDSNVNEPASNGFVEFKISQKEDLPLGTVINNKAAIYFDFNDPIITNETYHTLGEDFITVSLQRPTVEDYSLKVYPNPLQDFAIFEMKKEIRDGLFEMYDVSGKQVWQQKFEGKQFELHRNAKLNSGIYFYKISEKGNAINSGKIIMN